MDPYVLGLHEFVGKYPLEGLISSTCPRNNDRVLRNLNITDLPLSILSQLSNLFLRLKHPETPISMSVASSINQLQSAPKSAFSLLSNS